ncbi:hypothetical protein BDV24DRAFT_136375 [Aspergillus arachidicola]|uniref:Uncharacterized protein n=1 Tax=Aspergillus arachidicola TaxID=656916 RepID=A0A5N6Y142_9EURO|nr:hypothetical protein BDV24DRAFT_136375 [Aspergillus arachidicola]
MSSLSRAITLKQSYLRTSHLTKNIVSRDLVPTAFLLVEFCIILVLFLFSIYLSHVRQLVCRINQLISTGQG